MANLHYSLAGEGRGHAARARSLVDELRKRHDVTIHTFGDAFSFLAPLYAGTGVRVEQIPGLRFEYDRRGRVDYLQSTAKNLPVVAQLVRRHRGLVERLRAEGADLVLCDFEPSLPRAARAAGLPVLAVDHQSVLAFGDLSELPRHLRRHAAFLGAFVKRWTPRPTLRVSSSFYRPRLRPGASEPVRFVGVLLREAVREAIPTEGDHLLAYVRKGTPAAALEVLRRAPLPVRVYGRADLAAGGAIQPMTVSERGFLDDLASCKGVVSTAGNQLVGEAIHLGKPVLAMPEPGNREQEINAWFLDRSGAGISLDFDHLSDRTLARFVEDLPRLHQRCLQLDVDGTRPTLDLVESAMAGALSGSRSTNGTAAARTA